MYNLHKTCILYSSSSPKKNNVVKLHRFLTGRKKENKKVMFLKHDCEKKSSHDPLLIAGESGSIQALDFEDDIEMLFYNLLIK